MNTIEQYIQQRIETIGSELGTTQQRTTRDYMNLARIEELQNLLSKIEELEKQDKGSFLGFFRGEEMYYGNDVYKKYCAEREKELQELNK